MGGGDPETQEEGTAMRALKKKRSVIASEGAILQQPGAKKA